MRYSISELSVLIQCEIAFPGPELGVFCLEDEFRMNLWRSETKKLLNARFFPPSTVKSVRRVPEVPRGAHGVCTARTLHVGLEMSLFLLMGSQRICWKLEEFNLNVTESFIPLRLRMSWALSPTCQTWAVTAATIYFCVLCLMLYYLFPPSLWFFFGEDKYYFSMNWMTGFGLRRIFLQKLFKDIAGFSLCVLPAGFFFHAIGEKAS